MDAKLFTLKETANLLSLKESRLRTAVFKKEIGYLKIGHLIRFTMSDIQSFISKSKVEVINE